MYTDDTTIYGNKEDYELFESNVNDNLKILNNWFKLTKLSLNIEKTNLMIFRKKKRIDPIIIHVNQVRITETYFFGVVFNNKLTWTRII